MIDSLQKRSSCVRMGIQSVFVPNGGSNTVQDRMNQAWWYGGTFVELDDFFFWRAEVNDNAPYVAEENSAFTSQVPEDAATSWSSPSLASTTINSNEDATLTWNMPSQVYDRN